MKRYTCAMAVMAATLGAASLQAQSVATTQASVDSAPTGDPVYTDRVIGADGIAYNCRPDVVDVNGTASRLCRPANAGAGNTGALEGGTITAAGGVAAGVVAVALIASSNDDDAVVTSTTTTSP